MSGRIYQHICKIFEDKATLYFVDIYLPKHISIDISLYIYVYLSKEESQRMSLGS